jgi:hypothetical protein
VRRIDRDERATDDRCGGFHPRAIARHRSTDDRVDDDVFDWQ